MVKKEIREITSELVEAYIQCDRQAFLILEGKIERKEHEYSQILKERAAENQSRFEAMLKVGQKGVADKINYICHVIISDDMMADCLTLIKSESKPLSLKTPAKFELYLLTGTYTVTKEQRQRLAFAVYVTNVATQTRLTSGSIVTMDGQQHRVNLTPIYPTIVSTVNELRTVCRTEVMNPPRIILSAHCPLCPYCDHCRQTAESEDNLSLLGKMTQKVIRRYEKRGIFTIKQLSYLFNPRRRRKKSVAANSIFNLELQALAIRTEKIYLHETPLIPTNQVELFLDIEGIPDQGFHYLIGMIAVSQAEIQTYSFWADTQDDEATIFENCIAVAARYEDAPIYHCGSYEPKALSKIAKLYGLKTESIETRLINVNDIIYGKVYFPSKSNRLKDLGPLIGATWEYPDASGIKSIVWRYRWEEDRDERYKQKLLRYNQDDCQALKRLLNELRHIGNVAMTRNDVEFALKPKQISTEEGHIIHSKLQHIIVSAHEEQYQWNRLKIKRLQDSTDDNEMIRARRVDPIAARNISKKGGITIRLPRKRICQCHTPLIASEEITERPIIELFFTKSGCKKTIVRYVGKKAVCPSCKSSYSPPTIKLIGNQIFGHQFQSWVVHQRIVLRLPLAAISMQVEDLFNEPLAEASIDYFVRRFTKIYAITEKRLLEQILESNVVHVDETKINIKGTTQYAWVLTDGSHVVFWMTKTRETTILQELLTGYRGILVSDFYGGYDTFECRQQKCLVHLLRDLNEDLWKNPFNQEYEKFVADVSSLFVPIFDDVYKYGLKKRHLNKHVKAVSRFYEKTICVKSTCELNEKYRKRFERYRDSLFIFLEGDGIPWNNNMAERAIRHLAIQRKISGWFTKAGAERYLLLLGIAQTCRFQKKSFLRFLLSGAVDVDKFNERKQLPRNAHANS